MHIPAYPSRYRLWFRSECLVYRVAKMPFVFSHVEYCDMHFVYGFCNGNSRAAVVEYQRRFPDRRIPNRRVFTRIHQTLRDNGCFPSVSVTSERQVVGTITHERTFLRWLREATSITTSVCCVFPSTWNRETATTPNTS